MPKPLLKDMVPIRRQIAEKPASPIGLQPREVQKDREEIKKEFEPKKRSRYMLWGVALFSVVFCLFAFSLLFSKAEVIVNPKTQDVVLSENLSAAKDSSTGTLPFDLVVISGTQSQNLRANGQKDASIKATGNVIIYNAYSSAPQILSINTRLEGSNGKMYMTQTKTVVPGMTKSDPGSVEVGIYGSAAGADYNSAPLDFKIFGFKGTPKYSKFYGRSQGAITGGFVGKAPDMPEADQLTAEANLKTALQAKLLQQAADQIPSGFILFKDAIFLDTGTNNTSNISSAYNADNSMTLTLSGTLYGILFNEQKLTQKIATKNIDK